MGGFSVGAPPPVLQQTPRSLTIGAMSNRTSILIGTLVVASGCAAPSLDPSRTLTRIAFGSCAHQDRPQPIWDAIVASHPDVFLFLGDNIYADTTDMNAMRQMYRTLAEKPGYRRLLETCPVLATWDDHDYGADDVGSEYPKKKESQAIFLDFFGDSDDSPRRKREGVYMSNTYGPPGRRVQIILLDTRYFRSPLTPRKNKKPLETKYLQNRDPAATLLGTEQWRWLEQKLGEPAEIRIVASSIEVLVDGQRGENWLNFPLEQQRLFELLRKTAAEGVIFISGDCHYAELSRYQPVELYPLVELTSSALNQGWKNDGRTLPNRNRVGDYYSENNFGVIEIDWSREDPRMDLTIRDESGKVVIEQRVASSELRGS